MILVSDFDETLYTHNDPVQFQENLKAVKEWRKNPENKFVLATGRSLMSLQRVLPNYKDYLDYGLFDNGAVCVEMTTGKVTLKSILPRQTVQAIMAVVRQSPSLSKGTAVYYTAFEECPNLPDEVTKFRYWTYDNEIIKAVRDVILSEFAEEVKAFIATDVIPTSLPWLDKNLKAFVDVAPIGAGKEMMITRLQQQYYPDDFRIVTVGDGDNDLAMLRKFDGWAVAQAQKEVLETVAPDHIVNNVAELISKLG